MFNWVIFHGSLREYHPPKKHRTLIAGLIGGYWCASGVFQGVFHGDLGKIWGRNGRKTSSFYKAPQMFSELIPNQNGHIWKEIAFLQSITLGINFKDQGCKHLIVARGHWRSWMRSEENHYINVIVDLFSFRRIFLAFRAERCDFHNVLRKFLFSVALPSGTACCWRWRKGGRAGDWILGKKLPRT